MKGSDVPNVTCLFVHLFVLPSWGMLELFGYTDTRSLRPSSVGPHLSSVRPLGQLVRRSPGSLCLRIQSQPQQREKMQ